MDDKLLSATLSDTFFNITNNLISKFKLANILTTNVALTTKKKNVKNAVKNALFTNLSSEIRNNPKLECFQEIKPNELKLAPYLSCVDNLQHRISLTKLRISGHQLEVEKGRYQNIPREQRICRYCNVDKVENEIHFIRDCTLYNQCRSMFLQNNNLQKHQLTLALSENENNPDLIKKFAAFVYKIEKIRDYKKNNTWAKDEFTIERE